MAERVKCHECGHRHPEGFRQCVIKVNGEYCGCYGVKSDPSPTDSAPIRRQTTYTPDSFWPKGDG